MLEYVEFIFLTVSTLFGFFSFLFILWAFPMKIRDQILVYAIFI